MHHIRIKPLSLNQAYRGRRFATKDLLAYQEALAILLPKITVPKGKLEIWFEFGVSSKNSDGDNLHKAITDCIAEQYGFNDKMIYSWHGKKIDVKRGQEYIGFEIRPLVLF